MLIKSIIVSLIFFNYWKAEGKLKRICYGNATEYAEILLSPCFVDKTLLIKEFFDKKSINLITAPDGFGKTVNINMLKYFFAYEKEQNLSHYKKNRSSKYAGIITKNTRCEIIKEKNLAIYQDEEFFYQHCGKYPVIHANFNLLDETSFENILKSFGKIINLAFKEHTYLIIWNETKWAWANENLNKMNVARFIRYWCSIEHLNLNENEIINSLAFLSEILFLHFNQKPIILIDEYDRPIWNFLFGNISDNEINKTIIIFKEFISKLLKDNKFVERALVAGRLGYSGIQSIIVDNIKHFAFLDDHKFVKFFGLTSHEVIKILIKSEIAIDYDDVKEWYGGYTVADNDLQVYNTWSFLNYMNTEDLKAYNRLTNLTNLEEIFSQEFIIDKVRELLDGVEIYINIKPATKLSEILVIKNILNYSFKPTKNSDNADRILQFLYDNGYFVCVKKKKKKGKVSYKIKMANNEMFETLINQVYGKQFYETTDKYNL